MKTSEKTLLELFQAGDEESFRELYDRMAANLFRFALRYVGNADDAEDVVGQTFAEAFRCRGKFKGKSSLATWMYGIATHMAHRQLRKRKRSSELDPLQVDPSSLDVQTFCELQSMLGALNESQRAAFLLVRGEGLSFAEAASALGRSEMAVQALVYSGTKALRRFWSDVEQRKIEDKLEGVANGM